MAKTNAYRPPGFQVDMGPGKKGKAKKDLTQSRGDAEKTQTAEAVIMGETPMPQVDEKSAFDVRPAADARITGDKVPGETPVLQTESEDIEISDEQVARGEAALRRGARSEIGMIGTDQVTADLLIRDGAATRSDAGDLYITDDGMKVAKENADA